MTSVLPSPAAAFPSNADWGTPVPVELDDDWNAGAPRIAVGANGDAIAVFEQSDGAYTSIYASHFSPGAGWTGPVRIEDNASSSAHTPWVAAHGQGNARAFWIQDDGPQYDDVWTNDYTASGGWGSAQNVVDATYQVSLPAFATDPGGNATVVYGIDDYGTLADQVPTTVYLERYTAGVGWAMPVPLDALDGPIYSLDVAMSANGTTFVAWAQHDGSAANGYARVDLPGAGWQPTLTLDGSATWVRSRMRVVADASGDAFAAWQRDDGRIRVNRYVEGAGWTGDSPLQPVDGGTAEFEICADGGGLFFAVWNQYEASRFNLWARTNGSTSGFDAGARIEDGLGTVRGLPSIAAASGNATAAWIQDDGNADSLAAAHYASGAGWGPARFVEAEAFNPASQPSVGVDAEGGPIVVWRQDDGFLQSIWSNRMAPGLAPLSLDLLEPLEGLVTNDPTVLVGGTVTPGASVHANGITVDVDPAGAWGVLVALVEGNNRVDVLAQDAAGNRVTRSVNVTFVDPRVFVEENLTATSAALDQAIADLNATAAALADTQAALGAQEANSTTLASSLDLARTDLEALEARLNATAANLATASLQLNASQDRYVEAMRLLNETRASLAATQSLVDLLSADLQTTRAALTGTDARLENLQSQLDATNALLNETRDQLATANGTGPAGSLPPSADTRVPTLLGVAAIGIAAVALWAAVSRRRPPEDG